MTNTILRLPGVKGKTGLSRSTIYDKVQKKQFPEPVKIGERAVGWVEAEIDAWVKTRITERDGARS
ncbi:MAG TPA: AlpA family transcriptional regulator [Gemmataceae bacterium]|nr:AlpA family transcriptional regulator [Reyranella sp.]HZV03861.1 AlpA family transcriptional regulator [Gemmataceae bacterium]